MIRARTTKVYTKLRGCRDSLTYQIEKLLKVEISILKEIQILILLS